MKETVFNNLVNFNEKYVALRVCDRVIAFLITLFIANELNRSALTILIESRLASIHCVSMARSRVNLIETELSN